MENGRKFEGGNSAPESGAEDTKKVFEGVLNEKGNRKKIYAAMDELGLGDKEPGDLTDDEMQQLMNEITPKEQPAAKAENSAAAAEILNSTAIETDESGKQKKEKKKGSKALLNAGVLGLVSSLMLAGSIYLSNKDEDNKAPEPTPTETTLEVKNPYEEQEQAVDTEGEPVQAETGEEGEALMLAWADTEKYYFMEDKANDLNFANPSDVLKDVIDNMDDTGRELFSQGNKEVQDQVTRDTIMAESIESVSATAQYAGYVYEATGGKIFSKYITDGMTLSQIEQKFDELQSDPEAQNELLQEWKAALQSASFETATLDGTYDNNYLKEHDGKTSLVNCETHENGTEVTKITFHDEEGNDIGSVLMKINVSHAVINDENGERTVTCYDVSGHVIKLCMQMVSAKDFFVHIVDDTPPAPTPTPTPTPTPEEPPRDEKDPETVRRSTGGETDKQPAGEGTERHQDETHFDSNSGRGQNGSSDKAPTPTPVNTVRTDSNEVTRPKPDTHTDDQVRENQAREAANSSTDRQFNSNGEAVDYMAQFNNGNNE